MRGQRGESFPHERKNSHDDFEPPRSRAMSINLMKTLIWCLKRKLNPFESIKCAIKTKRKNVNFICASLWWSCFIHKTRKECWNVSQVLLSVSRSRHVCGVLLCKACKETMRNVQQHSDTLYDMKKWQETFCCQLNFALARCVVSKMLAWISRKVLSSWQHKKK